MNGMDDQPDSRLSGRRRAEDSVPLLYAISPCRPAGGPHGLLLVYGGQARIYAQNHKKAIPKALVWTSPAARALCRQAADSDEPDFEDGLVRACAENARVDFIVTRDVTAFARSKVRSIAPADYVARFLVDE